MESSASMGAGVDRAIERGTREEGGASTGRWLPLSPLYLSLRQKQDYSDLSTSQGVTKSTQTTTTRRDSIVETLNVSALVNTLGSDVDFVYLRLLTLF